MSVDGTRRYPYDLAVELRHLRYFLAVAEERNFGAAARRLHMAQPPLSQQIAGLEKELGVQLFDRTRRPVGLTPAGDVLAREAREVLDHADRLEHRMRRVQSGAAGRLVLAAAPSALFGIVPRLVRRHRGRYPEVEIVLHERDTMPIIDGLLAGRFDVAFLRASPRLDGFSVELLQTEPMVAALPESHPAARDTRVDLRTLSDETFITFPRDRAPDNFDLVIGACERAGFTPTVRNQRGPHHTQVAFVAAGLGIALVPASVACMRLEGVAFRHLTDPEPTVQTTIVWRSAPGWPARDVFVQEALALTR